MVTRNSIRQIIKNKQDVMSFGKFKGIEIRHILHDEPSYILWLDENEIVDFSDEIIEEAGEGAGRSRSRDDYGEWDTFNENWGDRD